MPELPEVETVRRVLRRALKGKRIAEVELVPDEIVSKGLTQDLMNEILVGAKVLEIGRKGKTWWLELDRKPWIFGHLGMSGWVRELGMPTARLKEHGKKPLDDESGRPRFLKLMITSEDGRRIAFTDGRRLGRLWLSEDAEHDKKVQALGFDCLDALPPPKELKEILSRRKAPIKAVLMDQSVFAGIGNWVADEVLYQARIAPKRSAASLSLEELERMREKILHVLNTAIEAGVEESKYPPEWLFMHRWGGSRGKDLIEGRQIIREPVGGRTTAWVPEIQK
jgi:formamidopyrimidine-DNA glycosylase